MSIARLAARWYGGRMNPISKAGLGAALTLTLAACGSATTTSESARPAPAAKTSSKPAGVPASTAPLARPSPTASAPPAASAPTRATDAAQWLKDMDTDGAEPEHRARLAASGLSEEQFGLPRSARKTLEAVPSPAFDASQVESIVVAMLSEAEFAPVVRKLCGASTQELRKAWQAAPVKERAKGVVDRCKLSSLVTTKDLPHLAPSSVLLAAVVEQLLDARGDVSPGERGLARLLVHLKRLDATH